MYQALHAHFSRWPFIQKETLVIGPCVTPKNMQKMTFQT